MVLQGIAANPVPSGGTAGFFAGAKGVRIRAAYWRPASGPAAGTVCLFHGRTEHIEKYFEVVEDLLRRGFAVATMDWRGQGGSDRALRRAELGHSHGFEHDVADLDRFMQEVALPDCPPPFYALAHSMGGTVLLHALTRRPSYFERAVLVAPMLGIALTRLSHESLGRAAAAACAVGLGRVPVTLWRRALKPTAFGGNPLTADPRRFERSEAVLRSAPHLRMGQPTFGWLRAACRAIDVIDDIGFPRRLETPVLLAAAGDDRIVSTRAIERLARRLRNGSLVMIPGARHEILMERDLCRAAFWGAFDAFIPGSPVFADEDESEAA